MEPLILVFAGMGIGAAAVALAVLGVVAISPILFDEKRDTAA